MNIDPPLTDEPLAPPPLPQNVPQTSAPVPMPAGEKKTPAPLDFASRYQALLQLSNAMIAETTQEGLFRCLAQELGRVITCDRFSISIYDAEHSTLDWFAVADGIIVRQMDLCPRSMQVAPIAERVITTRRPWLIPDMKNYTHLYTVKLMVEAGLTSTMAFPLITRDRVVGSLNISFRKNPEDYDNLVAFLSEISNQVAMGVDNMLSHAKLVKMNADLKRRNDYLLETYAPATESSFFHNCSAMRRIMSHAPLIADTDEPVLITGETGTGKDHLARYIHALSRRRDALFVKVNCPALSPGLFESELFGHVKGAFTGAHSTSVGRFAMAEGGTVFLDEIGELPMTLQAKLLHVLQDKCFERVGDSRPMRVDFRIIAATNIDLEEAIRNKQFRSDLYYRLNTVVFHLPPLRDRLDGLEALVQTMLGEHEGQSPRKNPLELSPAAMDALRAHRWPGNLRELRNIINRLVLIHPGGIVHRREIEAMLGTQDQKMEPDNAVALETLERGHIARMLALSKGIVGGPKGAAGMLGLSKSTLQYKLKKHGLNPADYRE